MLDQAEFWQLIDRSRDAADGDRDGHGDALRGLLAGLSREDLEAFARIYETLQWEAYHWDCWAAGYLLAGGMSDDSFSDFREWLISRGEQIYCLALENPEALVDEVPAGDEALSAEGLWSVAHEVYKNAFGEEITIFDDVPVRTQPAGEPWAEDEAVLSARYPRLWKRFSETY